jgi:hypothetical protein
MSKTYEKSNEALAILAQRGCAVVKEKARDLLLQRNEGLIYDKALIYWNYVLSSGIDRSLTLDDLVQLGRIKFCEALAAFDPLHGAKLTTFMTAVLNNYMIDTIRPGLKEKETIGGEFQWLDHYEGSEDQLTFFGKVHRPTSEKAGADPAGERAPARGFRFAEWLRAARENFSDLSLRLSRRR